MSVKSRIQKHRDRPWALRRRRLEMHLPNDLIGAANTFARQHKRYLRDIVTYALKDYLGRHGVLPPFTSVGGFNDSFPVTGGNTLPFSLRECTSNHAGSDHQPKSLLPVEDLGAMQESVRRLLEGV